MTPAPPSAHLESSYVVDRDHPGGGLIDENNVISSHRPHLTPIELAVGHRNDPNRPPVLSLQEVVSQTATSTSGGSRRVLFGVEGLVQAIAQPA